jgi:hypothetical protein
MVLKGCLMERPGYRCSFSPAKLVSVMDRPTFMARRFFGFGSDVIEGKSELLFGNSGLVPSTHAGALFQASGHTSIAATPDAGWL